MASSVAGEFLSEGKPVESLLFSRLAVHYQLHTPHGAIGFIPGVLAESREDLPRLLEALKVADRHNPPGIVSADAERHSDRFLEGRAGGAPGPPW